MTILDFFLLYVYIGILVGILFYLYETAIDIFYGCDHKFGCNCINPIVIVFCILLMIPFFNLWLLFNSLHGLYKKSQDKKKHARLVEIRQNEFQESLELYKNSMRK